MQEKTDPVLVTALNPRILICCVGLPRSGKSTWARQQPWPTVNPDSIRLAMHGQRFNLRAEPYVWAIADTMVRSLFYAGHKIVILDATNTSRNARSRWEDSHWKTYYKVFDISRQMCLSRVQDDPELVTTIHRMADQFAPLEPSANIWV